MLWLLTKWLCLLAESDSFHLKDLFVGGCCAGKHPAWLFTPTAANLQHSVLSTQPSASAISDSLHIPFSCHHVVGTFWMHCHSCIAKPGPQLIAIVQVCVCLCLHAGTAPANAAESPRSCQLANQHYLFQNQHVYVYLPNPECHCMHVLSSASNVCPAFFLVNILHTEAAPCCYRMVWACCA